MDTGLPLPHDLHAERAVLGAVLIEPGLIDALRLVLEPDAFYRRAHGTIYAHLLEVSDSGLPVDFLTLQMSLERAGRLDEVGGALYLSRLIDGVPRSTNAEAYAATVKELASRRAAISALTTAAAGVRELGASSEVIGPLLNALQSVETPFDVGIAHARRVAAEAERERTRRAARRVVDAEESQRQDIPSIESLSTLLARPEEVQALPRIEAWQPHGARVLFAAPRKTGKTTAIGNYIRCCADGDRWLDAYQVRRVHGTIVLADLEMQPRQLASWIRDQHIRNVDAVHVLSLRGRVAAFDILSPAGRQRWAAALREVRAEVLVFDCLRPALDALGLDENRDAGKFLSAFDALLCEAGVLESVIVHHFGHNGERSRGDSRIEDQADAIWKLVRRDDDPRSQRFISAYGRDIDVREQALEYEPVTRRLRVSGGSRKDAASLGVIEAILGLLVESGRPMNGLEIKRHFEGEYAKQKVDDALAAGAASGALRFQETPRKAKLWTPGVSHPEASREYPKDACFRFPATLREREVGKLEIVDQASGGERVRI